LASACMLQGGAGCAGASCRHRNIAVPGLRTTGPAVLARIGEMTSNPRTPT
jgi:hypothetical protein